MTINEMLTIVALIVGPIMAVQVEKYLSRRREVVTRREGVFRSLMVTRLKSVSLEHVTALNQIALEFPPTKFPETTKSWKSYFTHLNGDSKAADWETKRQDFLTELLMRMGKELKFKQEFLEIKSEYYLPQAHVNIDNDNARMRAQFIELLDGKRKLRIDLKD